jgi:hypothetical protein
MRNQKLFRPFLFLFAAAIIAAGFFPASGQAKKKKVTYYSIKSGTVFHVRIDNKLSSKSSYPGETFRNILVDPVYSSGGVELIPPGSIVHGKVTHAKPAAKDGKPGSIDVTFTSITLPNKRNVAISGMLESLESGGTKSDNEGSVSGKKTAHRNAKFIGGGAAGGAIIGGIAGGGSGAAIGAGVGAAAGFIGKKLMKGNEAEVKKGTEFGVYLNRSISLPRYR